MLSHTQAKGIGLGSRIQRNSLSTFHDFRCTLISQKSKICGDNFENIPVAIKPTVLQVRSSLSCLPVLSPLSIFLMSIGSTRLTSAEVGLHSLPIYLQMLCAENSLIKTCK